MQAIRCKPLVAVLALVALAASPLAGDVLKLKSGRVLRGEAVSYDDASKVVTFVTEEGTEVKVHADELDRSGRGLR